MGDAQWLAKKREVYAKIYGPRWAFPQSRIHGKKGEAACISTRLVSLQSIGSQDERSLLRELGDLHVSRHQYREAIDLYLKCLKMGQDAEVHEALAAIWPWLSQHQLAAEHYRKAAKYHRDSERIKFCLQRSHLFFRQASKPSGFSSQKGSTEQPKFDRKRYREIVSELTQIMQLVDAPIDDLTDKLIEATEKKELSLLHREGRVQELSLRQEEQLEKVLRSSDVDEIVRALFQLYHEPLPLSLSMEWTARALGKVQSVGGHALVSLAKKILDVYGIAYPGVREIVFQVAASEADDLLAAIALERWMALPDVLPDLKVELGLALAQRRSNLGDFDGEIRALCGAIRDGAGILKLEVWLKQFDFKERFLSGDSLLDKLEADVKLAEAIGEKWRLVRALRCYGGALWDLADDAAAAVRVWLQAARLDPEKQFRVFAADLRHFAGSDLALQILRGLVERESIPLLAGLLAGEASKTALELGQNDVAFDLSALALERHPAHTGLLYIAEQTAPHLDDLEAVYLNALRYAKGKYSRRAIHYRAATWALSVKEFRAAISHIIRALCEVPHIGFLYRWLLSRKDLPLELEFTMEQLRFVLSEAIPETSRLFLVDLLNELQKDQDEEIEEGAATRPSRELRTFDLLPSSSLESTIDETPKSFLNEKGKDGPQGETALAEIRSLPPAVAVEKWAQLSEKYEAEGDLKNALTFALEAAKGDAKRTQKWFEVDRIAQRLHDLPSRVVALSQLILLTVGEERYELRKSKAKLLASLGDTEGAEGLWEALFSERPSDEESEQKWLSILSLKEDDQAIVSLLEKKVERLGKNHGDSDQIEATLLRLASIYDHRLNEPEKALHAIYRLLGQNPMHSIALQYLGDLLEKNHNDAEATLIWERALNLVNEGDRDAITLKAAQAYHRMGREAQARSKILALSRTSRNQLANLELEISVLRLLHRESRARPPSRGVSSMGLDLELERALVSYAERSFESKEEKAKYLLEASELRISRADMDEAIRHAERAALMAPKHHSAQLYYAALFYRLRGTGTPETAKKMVQSLMEIGRPELAQDADIWAFLVSEFLDVYEGKDAGLLFLLEISSKLDAASQSLVSLGLGERYHVRGNDVESLVALQKAMRGDFYGLRWPSEIALLAADCAHRLGKEELAKELLRQALADEITREAAKKRQLEWSLHV